MSERIISPIGRVAYPNLVQARKRTESSKPRFSLTLVWGSEVNLTEFKAQLREVIAKEFPNGAPANFRSPLRSGSTRQREDGSFPAGFKADDLFAEFWRYEERGLIPVLDGNNNTIIQADIYAGCLGRVSFRPFVYNVEGNKGLGLSLEAFQKTGDGEPIGFTPVDPKNEFEVVSGFSSTASGALDVDDLLGV